ncbi:hypothetical protein HFO61_30545 [Rhizobium leguminosarum]|uniref:hypothetical protein n=1 Tax=Rhizobium leguminosarum TaxID=384 RepID=UPI001C96AB3C|nr:hypothetical protein [Rhizobium leguminosarum]MBY5551086.1 hypothetical protein [Rhizobium leguminosarum]
MKISKIDIAMLAITAGYLCLEIPFSVHLIETVAAGNEADISTVEKFGRILTGLAVGIFILGWSLLPTFAEEGTPRGEALGAIATGFVVSVAIAYFGLYGYGQWRAASTSDAELRRAYVGLMVQRDIAASGIGSIRPDSSNPAWRAFASTVSASLDMPRVIAGKGTVPEIIEREASRQIGTADEFRMRYFEQIGPQIASSYQRYAEGSAAYIQARRNIESDGAREWNSYVDELRQRYPQGVPTVGWTAAAIRSKVMDRLPVSSNWQILDRPGFMAAYRTTAAREIEERYRSQAQGLPAGMSEAQFWKTAKVQQEIRTQTAERFGIEIAAEITPAISDRAFQAALYNPVIEKAKAGIAGLVVEKQRLPAGDRETLENAYLIAALPASALLFSLAGAALHVFVRRRAMPQPFSASRGSVGMWPGLSFLAVSEP